MFFFSGGELKNFNLMFLPFRIGQNVIAIYKSTMMIPKGNHHVERLVSVLLNENIIQTLHETVYNYCFEKTFISKRKNTRIINF